LGELLERKQQLTEAYICFRRAVAKWKNISPYRAEEADSAAIRLADRVETSLVNADDARIEHKYQVWLASAQQF
jgi:hypothetical protein